jgi:hypothetical protein
MPARALSYWDYVKAAFRRRARVPLLGHLPLNQLALFAFALLGLANPGFWFLGAALEAAYLVLLSGNGSFQKLVQGEALLRQKRGSERKVARAIDRLSQASAERYRRLLLECRSIVGVDAPLDREGMFEDMRAGSLNQILWLFLRLLSSREAVQTTLAQVDRKALEADVQRLEEKLGKADPEGALARSLQASLEIQRKRLENLGRAKSSLEVIEAELERIEHQVRLIREESAVSGGPEVLSSRLDAVSSTLAETSKWMDQNADLFTSFSTDSILGSAEDIPPPPRPARKQTE